MPPHPAVQTGQIVECGNHAEPLVRRGLRHQDDTGLARRGPTRLRFKKLSRISKAPPQAEVNQEIPTANLTIAVIASHYRSVHHCIGAAAIGFQSRASCHRRPAGANTKDEAFIAQDKSIGVTFSPQATQQAQLVCKKLGQRRNRHRDRRGGPQPKPT